MNMMIVGYDLLGALIILLVIGVSVWTLHRMNEMHLRRQRIRWREELPLDRNGVPFYLPKGAQPMPRARRLPATKRSLLVDAAVYETALACGYDDLHDLDERSV
ncbi:MAG: hypothetical protein H0W02_24145 [Ktedonobacteraceae bacterium]|nr:hypothetical protein [Ktedonobacteraceae bacterium]